MKEVIRDMFPYISATVISIGIAWPLSAGVNNIYLKFVVKMVSMVTVYCTILWYSDSVIFKESLGYLKRKI